MASYSKARDKIKVHNILVMGMPGSGSSAITTQFCGNYFVETYDPTGEEDYRKQAVIDGKVCLIEILDACGQDEYSAMRELFFKSSEALILVYAITSRESFEKVPEYWGKAKEVMEKAGTWGSYPIGLVGNKVDLKDARVISYDEGRECAAELGCTFFETSARMGINIEEPFIEVVRQLRWYEEKEQIRVQESTQEAREAINDSGRTDEKRSLLKRVFRNKKE